MKNVIEGPDKLSESDIEQVIRVWNRRNNALRMHTWSGWSDREGLVLEISVHDARWAMAKQKSG